VPTAISRDYHVTYGWRCCVDTGLVFQHSEPLLRGACKVHPPSVAAAAASTRASSSGRESIGWCPVGSSTTESALLANSRCASGGVARSSTHTT
jgi:hypothetical protein